MGMFRTKAPRVAQEASYDPGIELMMEYAKRERMRARLPPVEDVADAFQAFFMAKKDPGSLVEDTHARLILQSLRYVLRAHREAAEAGQHFEDVLPSEHLSRAALVLSKQMHPTSDHLHLAEALFNELSFRNAPLAMTYTANVARMIILVRTGRPSEARKLLLAVEAEYRFGHEETLWDIKHFPDRSVIIHIKRSKAWDSILQGFVREGNDAHVLDTLEMMKHRGLASRIPVSQIMLEHCMSRVDVPSVKRWWTSLQTQRSEIHNPGTRLTKYHDAVSDLLKWCLRTGNLAFGQEVVRSILQANPEKRLWDAVFVWAAGNRKGVDEIARMMDVMEKSNDTIGEEKHWRKADVVTINALVECAISQRDPYMAERFINVGRERGIEPDARTFILQMDYRLSVGDVDGALVAYTHRQAHDLDTDEDFPAINRLLVALCTSQRHDFDTIMNVAADLSDRRARFEPLTVSALSVLHLNRDEIHDVIDLLNTHAFSFSSTDRGSVRQALTDYALLPTTSTIRSWDAYTILRTIFDEMPREPRTQLMRNFLSRERPDMAVNVFNHMRAHSREDTMPTIETYVSAFLGCAKLRDLESLEVIHNQLKLDYNVTPGTYVRNALVIAYTSCDRPRRALDFWDEIVTSREGPTYDSIHIALRACEKAPFGDMKAKGIWERLRRNNVELDQSMWASYIAALAGNGDNELAIGTFEKAVASDELVPDVFVLASMFNAAPGQVKQAEIEEFAKERFGDLWAEVLENGVEKDEDFMRLIKVDRSVTP